MLSRERSYRLEAIILRHQNWGEADRLLTLFSRQAGKLRAVAKGARKLRSRKAGHLEPFTQVILQLAKSRDLPIITQAEAIELYLPIREDLALFGCASYVVELLDRFTFEEGENLGLYQLLGDTLDRLAGKPNPTFTLRYYEIHLLELLGYRPQLFQCAICQATIQPQDQYFSAEHGGALCPKCGNKTPAAIRTSLQALKYLRHLQRSDYLPASKAKIPPAVNDEMESLLQGYITYLLERKLNTPGFMRRIKQGEQV